MNGRIYVLPLCLHGVQREMPTFMNTDFKTYLLETEKLCCYAGSVVC